MHKKLHLANVIFCAFDKSEKKLHLFNVNSRFQDLHKTAILTILINSRQSDLIGGRSLLTTHSKKIIANQRNLGKNLSIPDIVHTYFYFKARL